MKIKYELNKGMLVIPCPHGMNITGLGVCGVGSTSCTEDCPHFTKHDKENQIVECSRKNNFFVEIEISTPLHGSLKRVDTFPTQSSRNLFITIIGRWKTVKVIRFGEGDWTDV